MCTDMRVKAGMKVCIHMRLGRCIGVCIGHVYKHVHGRVYEHAHADEHVCGRVHGHVLRRVRRHACGYEGAHVRVREIPQACRKASSWKARSNTVLNDDRHFGHHADILVTSTTFWLPSRHFNCHGGNDYRHHPDISVAIATF